MMTLYEVLRASKQDCYRVFVGHSCGCLRLYPNKNGPLLDIDRYLTESWWKSISHSIMQYYIYICIYLFIYIYTGTFIFLVPLLMFLQLSSMTVNDIQWLLTTFNNYNPMAAAHWYVNRNHGVNAQELDIFYWSADATRDCWTKAVFLARWVEIYGYITL